MTYDMQIQIFGNVSNPEAIWELGTAAVIEGDVEWRFPLSRTEFENRLEAASDAGQELTLVQKSDDMFERVRSACQEAGLSYIMSYGDSSENEFTRGMAWHPGMNSERDFILHSGKVVLPLHEVEKAVGAGIERVEALVKEARAVNKPGKIEFSTDFKERYEEVKRTELSTKSHGSQLKL